MRSRLTIPTAVSTALLAAGVLAWITSYVPATKIDKAIYFGNETTVVLSDNSIVGLMLFDTSKGWRNATLVWELAAPYWLLTVAFAALPAWWCYRHFSRRRDPNLCRRCGYDQRGTHMAGRQVCPECGAVIRASGG